MQYKELKDYIPEEKITDIRNDFKGKLNFLLTKYRDKIINSFINAIQNANMKDLYKQDVWRCKFEFVAQDILNLDTHEGYSNNILKEFFNTICEDLKVTMVNYQFSKASEDRLKVYFILAIKNPLKDE